MAGEGKKGAPLRDWTKNSYDETGRSCSGLDPESKSYDRQIPSESNSQLADNRHPGRRNK